MMAWLKASAAARHMGVSLDVFEGFVDDGLPYSQPRKNRLFHSDDLDQYLRKHMKTKKSGKVGKLVGDILFELCGSHTHQ